MMYELCKAVSFFLLMFTNGWHSRTPFWCRAVAAPRTISELLLVTQKTAPQNGQNMPWMSRAYLVPLSLLYAFNSRWLPESTEAVVVASSVVVRDCVQRAPLCRNETSSRLWSWALWIAGTETASVAHSFMRWQPKCASVRCQDC